MSGIASHSTRDAALAALGWSGGPLQIGGIPATELVERFGSPLYVHDAQALRDRIAAVRGAFGLAAGDLLLALKANPLAALAGIAHAAGCGAEVASAGEILAAAAVGAAPIHFAGPGKSATDLQLACDHAVHVNLESAGEHQRLAALATARGVRPVVSIRVNPGAAQSGSRLRMADQSSRFGVDREQVIALARAIDSRGACDLQGLHCYGGSQSFDPAAWVATAEVLLELAAEVEAALGRPLAQLNFGGGFGWPVYDGDPTFDLATAAAGLRGALDRADVSARRTQLELGRYLLAGGGVYLTGVVDVKHSGDQRQVVLDGGMHQFGAAAGLGAVMRRTYAMVSVEDPVADRPDDLPLATLGGVLCTPADRFAQRQRLAEVGPGDVLAVLNAGAYGLTFSPLRFLGHPAPAEVVVDAGSALVARRRGRPEDALADQTWTSQTWT